MFDENLSKYTEAAYNLSLLQQSNSVLNPTELQNIWPEYSGLIPYRKSFGLWSSSDARYRIAEQQGRCDKVIWLVSGISAGGKDAIREEVEKHYPGQLHKLVTATTRPIREEKGEKHGVDYYFYSRDQFEKGTQENQFIEWVAQGDRLYGLPKQSLNDAISSDAKVIVSHVEMESGWPGIEDWLRNEYRGTSKIGFIRLFVMPELPFDRYKQHLISSGRDEIPARLLKAAKELALAPIADFVATNRFVDGSMKPLTRIALDAFKWVNLTLNSNNSLPIIDSGLEPSPGILDPLTIKNFQMSGI